MQGVEDFAELEGVRSAIVVAEVEVFDAAEVVADPSQNEGDGEGEAVAEDSG